MASELERELSRLGNLVQNKGKKPEDLEPQARINIEVRNFHSIPLFTDPVEQKLAEDKFRNYLENNELESASDLDTLKSLIFNEILENRIQGEFNSLATQNKYPPDKLIKSLVEVQNQKSSLKIKLGIDKKDEEKDDFNAYQLAEKRVTKYINDNRNEFTINLGFQCGKCGHKDIESFLLYKRVTDFIMLKHPWFAGKYLFNYEIIKDVKEKKISKEDATRYLMYSGQGKFYKPSDDDKKWCVDYITYCVTNFTEISDLLKQN